MPVKILNHYIVLNKFSKTLLPPDLLDVDATYQDFCNNIRKEQIGFRHEKSTVDQVVLLTQNIENFFEAKKKAGFFFVNLTVAYDTVWHRCFTYKLLRLLPDKDMVRMIMKLVRNRSFILITSDSKQSRLSCLKNGVPQGSVWTPFLFNIHSIRTTCNP